MSLIIGNTRINDSYTIDEIYVIDPEHEKIPTAIGYRIEKDELTGTYWALKDGQTSESSIDSFKLMHQRRP